MGTRYEARDTIINSFDNYRNVLKNRNVKFIEQYTTPRLRMPTFQEETTLTIVEHIWKMGDRFYKLAHKHYGEADLWWVIAWFNLTPTESHLQLGQTIQIPYPLERILDYYGV